MQEEGVQYREYEGDPNNVEETLFSGDITKHIHEEHIIAPPMIPLKEVPSLAMGEGSSRDMIHNGAKMISDTLVVLSHISSTWVDDHRRGE
ncbi:hypothetical protein GOP47_0025880 [Adiantum capillus-veneris]|uniref:Uncharacterized protein n=1 Tax=Adiantum capillus-veneris TaxID=13818 RepID=A0A9D4Z4J5_ADICA|nr:hypothetical protein GOP47_0025880 [Adiantum capillus-veneris]